MIFCCLLLVFKNPFVSSSTWQLEAAKVAALWSCIGHTPIAFPTRDDCKAPVRNDPSYDNAAIVNPNGHRGSEGSLTRANNGSIS